ncbi:MAG: hypothetical protein EBW56_04125, partial [Burkholderiaceae bacterium]|nr:hypothetical protein [Burkholderiaceae bacterium]
MAVVSGGSVSAQNTGVIVSAGSWTSIYTAHGLDTRGDTIVAHITDKNSGKIYRVTYLVTNNSSNTTDGFNPFETVGNAVDNMDIKTLYDGVEVKNLSAYEMLMETIVNQQMNDKMGNYM